MYKGYNLTLTMESFSNRLSRVRGVARSIVEQYVENAKISFSDFQNAFLNKIRFIKGMSFRIINGNEVEESWFPKMEAQVFISHSHADESLAYALSGWMRSVWGITSFIDSGVWGYRNDLIDKLSEGLSFFNRQKMVEHVDCMLMKSLMQMIDHCECLIFLNTPNSICSKGISAVTYSPWLFSELNTSRYIRRNIPARHTARMGATMDESVLNSHERFSRKMGHDIPVNHLKSLNIDCLLKWRDAAGGYNGELALDQLYSLF